MAFRIGGLPIFSPIKIPSRLPHDGLPARHSRFKLIPTTAERPRERERESTGYRVSEFPGSCLVDRKSTKQIGAAVTKGLNARGDWLIAV